MPTEPTPKDTVFRDGNASLYHFRNPAGREAGPVVLLVPSMINRWYVLDLHEGASLANAFVDAGFDTYCLDWGIPEDEDRYLTWDLVLDRLGRMVRKVRRLTGEDKIGLLGYCMGGTLCGIWTALNPDQIEALVNLAGPFDFSEAGLLGEMTDERWFDAESVASAGNVAARQMQSGFIAMRPTSQLGKWVSYVSKIENPAFRRAFKALDTWAEDNIPFPGAAYVTYIEDLYQGNLLVKGEHYVRGERVDLGEINCPTLTIGTSRDHICPPKAAMGLHENVGAQDREMVVVEGGHVGAVVGSRAKKNLYPIITNWLAERLERNSSAKGRVNLVTDPPQEPAQSQRKARPAGSPRATSVEPPAESVFEHVEAALASGLKADLIDALEAVGLDPSDYSNNSKRSVALRTWMSKRGDEQESTRASL